MSTSTTSVSELVNAFQAEYVPAEDVAQAAPVAKAKRIRVALPERLVLTGTSYMTEKPDHRACWSGYTVLQGTSFLIRFFGDDADALAATVGAGRVDNEPNPEVAVGTRTVLQCHAGSTGTLYEAGDTSPEFLALDHASCLTGRFYTEVPVRQEMVSEKF